jgi:DNA polymerase III delta prime subunit|tara:strand:- start:270 stop:1457 length:1188 start_codon:yes stop_codon:yes gene_type:complete
MKEAEYHLRQFIEPSEVPEATVQLEMEGYPVILSGPPGMGKTLAAKKAVIEISRRHNDGEPMPIVNCNSGGRPGVGEYGMQIFNATGYDPEDFAMPAIGDRTYDRYVTTALPGADASWTKDVEWADIRCTVIAEEMGKKPENFKIWSELFNERTLGTNYQVPPHSYFIGTTNGADDGAGAFAMHSDLIRRACILQVRATVKGFLKYHKGELHPLVSSILKYQGDQFLFTQDDEASGKPFCTPSTVFQASNLLNTGLDMDSPISEAMMLGIIGFRGTAELFATYRAGKDFGDLDEMLADPDKYSDKIDQLRNDMTPNGKTMLCSVICMLVSRLDKKRSTYQALGGAGQINNIIKFVNRIDQEASVACVSAALALNEDIQKEEEFIRHYAQNQDFYF